MSWVADVLKILAEVVSGALSKDEAAKRIALLDVADAAVDVAEKKKLGD